MFGRIVTICIASIVAAGIAAADIIDRPHFNVHGAVIVWAADNTGQAPVVADFIIDTGSGSSAAASGDIDLIAGDVHTVLTGSLVATDDQYTPATEETMPIVVTNTSSGDIDTDTNGDGVLSAADGFSAFGLQINSDTILDAAETRTSFYVASNTPFAIDAQVIPNAGTTFPLLLATRMSLEITQSGDDGLAFGSAAQFPHSAGASGGMAPERRLFDYLNARRIFSGNQRTAAIRGSIAEQSVRFDATYAIRAANLRGYDLSMGTFDFEVDVVYTVFVP